MSAATVTKPTPTTLKLRHFDLGGKKYLIEDSENGVDVPVTDISFSGIFWCDKWGTGMSYPLYILRRS